MRNSYCQNQEQHLRDAVLVLVDGSVTNVTHTFFDRTSGTVDVDGSTITYNGLEPITDYLNAVDRVFMFGAGDDDITISDDDTAGNGISRIASVDSSETVDFVNPTDSITVNLGAGSDTVSAVQFDADPGETFDVIFNGESGDLVMGAVDIEHAGNLTVLSDGDVSVTGNITAPSMNVLADGDIAGEGLLSTGTAAGSITLNAGGELYLTGTDAVSTVALEAVAVSGMFLRTEVEQLDAYVTGAGILEIHEKDDITLNEVTNAGGPIYMTAGGDMTATWVEAEGNPVSLSTAGGSIEVGQISAGTTGRVALTSSNEIKESGDDAGVDLTAAVLDLDAGSGIGQAGTIETAASSIAADTINGKIDIDNTLGSPVTVTSLTTGTGDIRFSQAGGGALTVTLAQTTDGDIAIDVFGADLTAEAVTAGGVGKDIVLTTVASGSIAVDRVTADSDVIAVTSAGAVEESGDDAGAELTAAVLDIDAGSGIGQAGVIETAASIIAADTINGKIDIDNTLGSAVTVTSLTTGSEDIQFSQAGGGAPTVTLAQTTDGDIAIDVFGADLTAETVTAGGNEQNIVLTTVNSGDIRVEQLTTADGSITVEADGSITALSVKSETDRDENDIRLTAADGDINADLINAQLHEGDVILTSAGVIDATLMADVLTIQSDHDAALTTTVNLLDGESYNGIIEIEETDDVLIRTSLKALDGAISLHAGATIVVTGEINALNEIELAAGEDIYVNGQISGDAHVSLVNLASVNDTVVSGQIRAGDAIEIDAANIYVLHEVAKIESTAATSTVSMDAVNEAIVSQRYGLSAATVKAGQVVSINAREIRVDGSVTTVGPTSNIGFVAADDISVTGLISSSDKVDLAASNIYIFAECGKVESSSEVKMNATGDVLVVSYDIPDKGYIWSAHNTFSEASIPVDKYNITVPVYGWLTTEWYTTIGVSVNQIGWIDPATMTWYEAGISGEPIVDAASYELTYGSSLDFKRLYQVRYIEDTGRYVFIRNSHEYVLIENSAYVQDNIANDAKRLAPEFEGFVYISTAAYNVHKASVTSLDYEPLWSDSNNWEVVHAREFLADAYKPANPDHDYYVLMQVGAKEDIKETVVSKVDAITNEDIGDTRVVTNMNLHQIGWWNPATSEGLRDARAVSQSPESRVDGQYQTGEARPGEAWVAWYGLEVVGSKREVILTDGRVYSYEGYPVWMDDIDYGTRAITVDVNGTDAVLYIEVPAGMTDDLNVIEWRADLQGAATYDAASGTFTIADGQDVVIPVNAIQVDVADDYDVGEYAEYLGEWRDDWGMHRSGDAYSHDSGLRDIGTIIDDSIANDKGEPGYVMVIGREGTHANRHEVLQDMSYGYIWARDDWGEHVGDRVSNTIGLDAIGYVIFGEDGRSDEAILSDSIDDYGHNGAIEVLDHYEGIGNDTQEVWYQYSSEYNWSRDVVYTEKYYSGHKSGIWKHGDEYIYINADGNVAAKEGWTEPLIVEDAGRGKIRVLIEIKYDDDDDDDDDHDDGYRKWIVYSAKYKDNAPLEGGNKSGSVYADKWVVDYAQDPVNIGSEYTESESHYNRIRRWKKDNIERGDIGTVESLGNGLQRELVDIVWVRSGWRYNGYRVWQDQQIQTINVDLSQLDVKEIGTAELIKEKSHYRKYRKVIGGAEVQVKWGYGDSWETADPATIDGQKVYAWRYSSNQYQSYKNMTANDYDGGKYRDYLDSYVGDYTTAETVLSGRQVGEVEDISNVTVNDGTGEFARYEWNETGTEYREIWHHYSDWYKDFSVTGQDVRSIYDTYVPTQSEQAAEWLKDMWGASYAGAYTNAETLVKALGTVEDIVGGIKTLIDYVWDGDLYHEIWHHESDPYKHYDGALERTSNYDKVAWEDATETRIWDQVLTGSHFQDQGHYGDGGYWNEVANIGANRDNPLGEGNNDQWIQALYWVENLVHIDEFEDRYHTNIDLIYNWHHVWDARENYAYEVTNKAFGKETVSVKTSESAIADGAAKLLTSTLIITAGNDVKAKTAVDNAIVDVTAAGRIYLREDDGITLTRVSNNDGTIDIEAGGTIEAILMESGTDADANDITITTTNGDINGTLMKAGLREGDIFLTSSGNIDTDLIADVATIRANNNVSINTRINTLDLVTFAQGDVVVNEFDQIRLDPIRVEDGSVSVTAGDRITAIYVEMLTDRDVNEVSLTTTYGDIEGDAINAGFEGDVTLNAAGALKAVVAADLLVARAGGNMILDTTVLSLDGETTAAGDVTINETDDIILISVRTFDGSITVTAAEGITATLMESLFDADGNDCLLTTRSGDIEVGAVNAGALGDVTLTSAGKVADLAGKIVADPLVAVAIGPMVLDTTVNRLFATNQGELKVTETDGITMTTDVASLTLTVKKSGDATVTEGNDLMLASVQLSDGTFTVRANNITVTGTVSAHKMILEAGGVISVDASGLLVGGDLNAVAAGGMNLNTHVNDITAHVTGKGNIMIAEKDAIVLSHISTADGWITVTADGDIIATLINCITDADANDIMLTTTGSHIQAAEIDAGSLGDVILTSTGPLTATVTADELSATAAGDMTLQTTVASLIAETTGTGNIQITETDKIDLTSVRSSNGSITVTAGNTITALNMTSFTDAIGNDINLTTTVGDVLIDSITGIKGTPFCFQVLVHSTMSTFLFQ